MKDQIQKKKKYYKFKCKSNKRIKKKTQQAYIIYYSKNKQTIYQVIDSNMTIIIFSHFGPHRLILMLWN